MAAIDKMVDDIRYKGQILARTNKIESALSGNGLLGFGIGLVLALLLIHGPILIAIIGALLSGGI